MSIYEEFAEFAQEMLVEFGTQASMTVTTAGEFDPVKNRPSASTVETTSCLAVIITPTPFENNNARVVKTTTGVFNKEPIQGATLNMGDRSWTIGTVTTVQPTNLPIIWFAEVE
ncbi:hypothetical protein PF049_00180 [Erythrobacteraceae bacterium WH01K]|nr:hypothetical protein PF049_00180 [Erythrobacteraceae bacterium WH01K]